MRRSIFFGNAVCRKSILYLVTVSVVFFVLACTQATTNNRDVNRSPVLNFNDTLLARMYKNYCNASDSSEWFERARLIFEGKLKKVLEEKRSFNNRFDSLSKYLTIISSPDSVFRIFSWHYPEKGTWHFYQSLIQFRNGNLCKVYDFHPGGENCLFSDSRVYDVFLLNSNNYLLMASGTHGGGMQHQMAAVYELNKLNFSLKKNSFVLNNPLVFQYPRADKLELRFDTSTKILSFNEIKEIEESMYDGRTGANRVRLKWNAVRFENHE